MLRNLPASHSLQLLLGLVVWALWFVAVYGGLSVACSVLPAPAERGPFGWVNGVLLALTVATAAFLAGAAFACGRAASRIDPSTEHGVRQFIARAATALYAIAAFSTLFVGLPLLVIWPCV